MIEAYEIPKALKCSLSQDAPVLQKNVCVCLYRVNPVLSQTLSVCIIWLQTAAYWI